MAKMATILVAVALSFGLVFVTGCENDAKTGALLGTGVGAGIGALVGGDTEGALIGAAVGGGAGYMLGNEGDKKKGRARTDAEIAALRTEQNTATVWVTNTNGSKISVKLFKSGPNYIGPKNEIYDHLPTEEELRPVYGF